MEKKSLPMSAEGKKMRTGLEDRREHNLFGTGKKKEKPDLLREERTSLKMGKRLASPVGRKREISSKRFHLGPSERRTTRI